MGIFTKRNAFIGWIVIKLGKRSTRKRVRGTADAAVRAAKNPKMGGPIGAGIVALVAALLFWRKKRSKSEPPEPEVPVS